MLDRFSFVLSLMLLVAACGCATTQSGAKSEVMQLREEVASLRAENAALKSDLSATNKNFEPFKEATLDLNPWVEPKPQPGDPDWTLPKVHRSTLLRNATVGASNIEQMSGENVTFSGVVVGKSGGGSLTITSTQPTQPTTKPAPKN